MREISLQSGLKANNGAKQRITGKLTQQLEKLVLGSANCFHKILIAELSVYIVKSLSLVVMISAVRRSRLVRILTSPDTSHSWINSA